MDKQQLQEFINGIGMILLQIHFPGEQGGSAG